MRLLPFLLSLALLGFTVADDDCCGTCRLPDVDSKDCPPFGFDCHRQRADLGLFKKSSCKGRSTLKCADKKAKLFVGGEEEHELKCKDGKNWKSKRGCSSVKTAVCGKACTDCPTTVPSFLSANAASVSTVGGTSNDAPCTIGFCDGLGLTLTGVDTHAKASFPIDGNLTCTGSGWQDSNGKVYQYAVCTYYVCNVPTSLAAGDNDGRTHVEAVAVVTRALECPGDNYTLGYYTTLVSSDLNQYSTTPLICGPGNKWTSLGIPIDNVKNTHCENIWTTCNIDLPSLFVSCADNPNCESPIIVDGVVEYPNFGKHRLVCPDRDHFLNMCATANGEGCAPITGGIPVCNDDTVANLDDGKYVACMQGNCAISSIDTSTTSICPTTPGLCSAPTVTPSSISCPNPGDALIYNNNQKVFGNLTCVQSNNYADVTSIMYLNNQAITNVVCTSLKTLSCDRLPWMFTEAFDTFYVLPPGVDGDDLFTTVQARITVDVTLTPPALIMKNPTVNSYLYINNNLSLFTTLLTCNNKGQWIADDGKTVATTASPFVFVDCDINTVTMLSNDEYSPPTGNVANGFACPASTMYYIVGDNPPVKLGAPMNPYKFNCGPGRQWLIPSIDYPGYTYVTPAVVSIGCK